MKIDREKVTPEVLTQMREVLAIAQLDPWAMSDDEVIEHIERIFRVLVEFSQKFQAIMHPVIVQIIKASAPLADPTLSAAVYLERMRSST